MAPSLLIPLKTASVWNTNRFHIFLGYRLLLLLCFSYDTIATAFSGGFLLTDRHINPPTVT